MNSPTGTDELKDRAHRLSKNLTFYTKLVSQCAVVTLGIVVIVYFIVLVCSRNYRVAVVDVPKSISDKGTSEDVARHLLAKDLSHLQDLSNTTIDHRFQADKEKIDFTIPKTSFSFQTLVSWTKDAVGLYDTLISVEVTERGDALQMSSRITRPDGRIQYLDTAAERSDDKDQEKDKDKEKSQDKGKNRSKDFDALLELAASDIMRALNPLVSGTATLATVKSNCLKSPEGCSAELFNSAISDLQGQTHDSHLEVFHRAFISLADLYAVSGDHDTAIFYLNTLIKRAGESKEPCSCGYSIDKNVLDAHLMRGVEFTAINNHRSAEDEFKLVITEAPKLAMKSDDACDALHSYAYEDLAKDIIVRHAQEGGDMVINDYKTAIDSYKNAINFCPHNTTAKAGLGYALFVTEQFQDANTTLQELLTFDASIAQAHKDLGRSLRELALQELRKTDKMAEPTDCALFSQSIHELKLAVQWADINESAEDAAQAHLDLGKTYRQCHDYKHAREELNNSLAKKDGYSWALAELKELSAAETASVKK